LALVTDSGHKENYQCNDVASRIIHIIYFEIPLRGGIVKTMRATGHFILRTRTKAKNSRRGARTPTGAKRGVLFFLEHQQRQKASWSPSWPNSTTG
jgi:hypothetical protein